MGDPSINVLTSELKRFADDVHFGADEVLAPAVDRAATALREGATFGARSASGAVHAAKQRYAQSLSRSLANLTEFVEAATVLAAAARTAAQEFESADSRSADGMLRVAADQARASRAQVPG